MNKVTNEILEKVESQVSSYVNEVKSKYHTNLEYIDLLQKENRKLEYKVEKG